MAVGNTVDYEAIAEYLRKETGGKVSVNEPMKKHTTFRIGGPADILFVPSSLDDLRKALSLATEREIPITVIGGGSNLLVRDSGIRGIVIKIDGALDYMSIEDGRILAGSGTPLSALSRAAAEAGISGMEFCAGIPGTVGGAVAMNAGAHGSFMEDIILKVRAMGSDGGIKEFAVEECGFGVKSSRFQNELLIITEVEFRAVPGDKEEIKRRISDYLRSRREKQPLTLPSAGCIFRNPSGGGAGRYIDSSGCKGLRVGDAQVSELHANFIVNLGSATCQDVLDLIELVKCRVREKEGVELEPEVRVLGD